MDKDKILQTSIALTNAAMCNAINSYYETQGLPKMPSTIAEDYRLIIELQLAYRLLLEIIDDPSVVSAFEPYLAQSANEVADRTKALTPDDTMHRQMKMMQQIARLAD